MALALACNIFLFFANGQTEAKLQEELPFVRAELDSRSLRFTSAHGSCGLAELGGCTFHEGKMRDKEEAKKLTEKAHFASLTDLIHYKKHDELTI